jgi:glyoxalase family protein
MELTGIHHLTAITSNALENLKFYTKVLGLRLVKKSVNQDDVTAYHLFYADNVGSPGTDITFFDWNSLPEKRGTNSIVRTAYQVRSDEALDFWAERFNSLGVTASPVVVRDERKTLDFEDPEGQRLSLVLDLRSPQGVPREGTKIPPEYQLQSLGPVTISVSDTGPTFDILEKVLSFKKVRAYKVSNPDSVHKEISVHVFQMSGSGAHSELHVMHEPDAPPGRPGAGGVHHVAFRIPDFDQYDAWTRRLKDLRIPSSGPIDRYYFKSLYFREPNGILFEFATDGPGFATDEPLDALGEKLALPPFLEGRRVEIESGLKKLF